MGHSEQQLELAAHRKQLVVQMTRGGSTASEIASTLGISANTVRNIRRKTRVLAREPNRRVTAEQEQRIQEMAVDGVSINEIARTLRISFPAVKVRAPWAVWDTKKCAEWGAFHRKPNRKKGANLGAFI